MMSTPTTAAPTATAGKKRSPATKKAPRPPQMPSEGVFKSHLPVLRVRLTTEVDAKTVEPLLKSSGAKEVLVVELYVFGLFETAELAKAALESLRKNEVGGKTLRVEHAKIASTYKLNAWTLVCPCSAQFKLAQKGEDVSAHKHYETCALLHPVAKTSEGAVALLELLFTEFYKQISLKDTDYNSRHGFHDQIQLLLSQAAANNILPPCMSFIYGSALEGTVVPGEHFELSVINQSNVSEKQLLPALHQFLSFYCRHLIVGQTHVPALIQTQPDGFPFAFNIVVNRDICIFSSQLIRDYFYLDRRLKPLVVALKTWAQSIGLFNENKSWLSSFCFDLLVIYFFQIRNPALLPNLQKDIEHTSADQCRGGFAVEGENCFWRSSQFLPRRAPDATGRGELLLQLFHFYGTEFNFAKNMVSIRLGVVNAPRPDSAKKGALYIEDPFRHHNLADGLKKGINFAAKCLEAHNKLASTGDLKALLYGNVTPKPTPAPTATAETPATTPATTTVATADKS